VLRGFIVKRDQPLGIVEQPLSVQRRRKPCPMFDEDRPAYPLFQPGELMADGGLGEVQRFGRAGDAAQLQHSLESSQGLDIEAHRDHDRIR